MSAAENTSQPSPPVSRRGGGTVVQSFGSKVLWAVVGAFLASVGAGLYNRYTVMRDVHRAAAALQQEVYLNESELAEAEREYAGDLARIRHLSGQPQPHRFVEPYLDSLHLFRPELRTYRWDQAHARQLDLHLWSQLRIQLPILYGGQERLAEDLAAWHREAADAIRLMRGDPDPSIVRHQLRRLDELNSAALAETRRELSFFGHVRETLEGYLVASGAYEDGLARLVRGW